MDSKAGTLKKGRYYEDIASEHLKRLKYKIIERNYRTRLGEIDLICSEGNELVFVEVKGGKKFPEPHLRVDHQKLHRLEITMRHYLHHTDNNWEYIRLDVISISEPDLQIKHFKDVLGR
ncbi:MAG TPA: YraN family protein [Thermotogota bacterium]|nr:YraN family protein [Thermotogota bacterium]